MDDALERVAHGATVSISAILLNQGLGFGFTVVLTNGFGAASYGFFVQSLVVVVVGVLLATGVGGGSLPSRG